MSVSPWVWPFVIAIIVVGVLVVTGELQSLIGAIGSALEQMYEVYRTIYRGLSGEAG